MAEGLDPGDEITHFAGRQAVDLDRLGRQVAQLLNHIVGLHAHERDRVADPDLAVEDPHENDDAAVRIEPGIEKEGFKGRFRIALGGRHPANDGLQDLGHVLAGFGAR